MKNKEFIPVVKVEDLPIGKSKRVQVGDHFIALFHLEEGFFALDDACPHQGAPLAYGIIDGREVVCLRHGARFDIPTGQVLSLPAVRGVHTYPVRVEGDMVCICIEPVDSDPPALIQLK